MLESWCAYLIANICGISQKCKTSRTCWVSASERSERIIFPLTPARNVNRNLPDTTNSFLERIWQTRFPHRLPHLCILVRNWIFPRLEKNSVLKELNFKEIHLQLVYFVRRVRESHLTTCPSRSHRIVAQYQPCVQSKSSRSCRWGVHRELYIASPSHLTTQLVYLNVRLSRKLPN